MENNRSEVIRVCKEFNDYIKNMMKSHDIKNTSDATKYHIQKFKGKYNEKFKF